jgi:hypothetical protein
MWNDRVSCALLVVGALLLGCSGGTTVVSKDAVTTDVADGETAVAPDLFDLSITDSSGPELAAKDVLVFDLMAPDEGGPECAPGEGCFLDPCQANEDCLSGWCVLHMGEKVCTTACQAECPAGWDCQQVAGTAPDLVFVCVSQFANLCRPCAQGADCKSVGGAEDVCVDYGDEGNFCGGGCGQDDHCPWGFSCVETTTVDGIETSQCVADAGVCPCTKASAELALWTPCDVQNEFGICQGKRVCAETGLTECDALLPMAEMCNGQDDDCDGEVDEGTFVEDKYLSLCDDGNPCSEDQCTGAGGCQYVAMQSGECLDGDPCTVADHCVEGVCVGQQVDCDDKNPCTDDGCDEVGGCIHSDNVASCDDADPCTVADQCSGGVCAGVAVNCDCETDSDCGALEDGDLCNGVLLCDTNTLPYQCRVDTNTIIDCPAPEGPGAICLTASCDPVSGACSLVADNDNLLCEDGDACSVGDTCGSGECIPGVTANCNDGNPCTDDSCDPLTGCQHLPNVLECNDGDVCTKGDLCAEGDCVSGPLLECDDGNLCTDDACDPAVGCVHESNAAPCDDGNACTDGDLCVAGSCKAGLAVDCDDDNPCTGDSCSAANGCVYTMLDVPCDDGNSCTGPDVCQLGECAGAPLVCDDDNPCTDDGCQDGFGCLYTNNAAVCNDGNSCTIGDHCVGGECVYEGLSPCNDDNVCTTDSCDPEKGCLHLLNQAPCNDGDICTTGDICQLGDCVGTKELVCNDGNECTADSCDPDIGCEFVPVAGDCDDGTTCTQGDVCFQGQCVATSFLPCDDDNPCTDDSCHPVDGCVHTPNVLPCDDGDACTLVDLCAGGLCLGTSAPDCDDKDVCTDDSCDAATGCVHVNNSAECNDGDKCTPFDQCSDGICVGSGVAVCDDENLCTDDSCDPEIGCVFAANTVACDDNNACTLNDVCSQSTCQAGPDALDCDDLEPCTDDSCVPETGCVHLPLEDNTDCGGGSTCQAGICTSPCTPGTQTFNYTGGQQTFVMPDACKTVQVELWGAKGGNRSGYSAGGNGGYAKGVLATEAGATLYLFVGQFPGVGSPGGWNGGGNGDCSGHNEGGGGGGASDIRVGGTSLDHRVVVAAGGGGGGGMHENNFPGGVGGGQTGGTGTGNCPGQGGTQTTGGAKGADGCQGATSVDGSFGAGGCGASGGCGLGGGGGGGGGWYGGGGGGTCSGGGSSAGGGSSYVGGVADGETQSNVNGGHGKIVLTWP